MTMAPDPTGPLRVKFWRGKPKQNQSFGKLIEQPFDPFNNREFHLLGKDMSEEDFLQLPQGDYAATRVPGGGFVLHEAMKKFAFTGTFQNNEQGKGAQGSGQPGLQQRMHLTFVIVLQCTHR